MDATVTVDLYEIADQLSYKNKLFLFKYLFNDLKEDDLTDIIQDNLDSCEIASCYEANDMLRNFTKEELINNLLSDYSIKEINEYLQTLNYKLNEN